MLKRLKKNQKGAALLEYALLIAGIALIGGAAVSTFGHKTADLIGTVAVVIPGAHPDDNAPIISGHLLESGSGAKAGSPAIGLSVNSIDVTGTVDRLNKNVGLDTGNGDSPLIVEP